MQVKNVYGLQVSRFMMHVNSYNEKQVGTCSEMLGDDVALAFANTRDLVVMMMGQRL